jgi:hypothetical protein
MNKLGEVVGRYRSNLARRRAAHATHLEVAAVIAADWRYAAQLCGLALISDRRRVYG